MKRKIVVVTGSRADYGILKNTIINISKSNSLELNLVVMGQHLSSKYGNTYKEILKDKINIKKKIYSYIDDDSEKGINQSISLGIQKFSQTITDLKPDIVLLLGDRFEILSAAIATLICRIPIAHIHGGEVSEGSIDESIRHSITKMSHLHFVSLKKYRDRLIQLGENKKHIYIVGALGIENVKKRNLISKKQLQKVLKINFLKKNLIITYHPSTSETNDDFNYRELLSSLSKLKDTLLIFTFPNMDLGSKKLIKITEKFVSSHKNTVLFKSLGYINYLSCLKYVDGVVGNSSSGIIEVPSFKIGTVNIGNRQKGRELNESIIVTKNDNLSISKAIKKLYSSQFIKKLTYVNNIYDKGESSKKITSILEKVKLDNIIKKKFFDL